MNLQTFNPGNAITQKWIALDPTKVIAIIVHHAEASKASPADVNRWHTNNGWAGIGYNEYIRKDGTVYICRGMHIGSQCANFNSKSYGICLEGEYMRETVPPVQLQALVERVRQLSPLFPNLVEVAPHSKYYPTACPGSNFPMVELKRMLTDDLYSAVRKLVQAAIVSTPDYWLTHAQTGQLVNSSYLQALIIKAVRYFSGLQLPIESALEMLLKGKIINSPEYWSNSIKKNQDVRGDFVAILIKNIASKI